MKGAGEVHPNEERIRAFYQAVATRDTDLLTAMMAEDMVTTVPGHSPVAGRREGREAVLGLLGRAFEETAGNFSAELLDVLANDRYAVTLHRWTAQRKGANWSPTTSTSFVSTTRAG